MSAPDKVEELHGASIQHGPHNQRIYLMKLRSGNVSQIIPALDQMAEAQGYGKIFVKVPAEVRVRFEQHGYCQEALVPGFFRGAGDAVFLAKYPCEERRLERHEEQIRAILESVLATPAISPALWESKRSEAVAVCALSDAREMSHVYRQIFPTYPIPIDVPEYIADTMKSHTRYFCVRYAGKIVALASSETDMEDLNVEMTDFATLPDHRRQGLAGQLLAAMERSMTVQGIRTAYTIARALSPGINRTFRKMGYSYAGKLANNTNISGQIESMNVWYKKLGESDV